MKANPLVGCALERTIWQAQPKQFLEQFFFKLKKRLNHFDAQVLVKLNRVRKRCAQERTLQVARGDA
jgi:hypothetical protein